jgi:hypothetical protein
MGKRVREPFRYVFSSLRSWGWVLERTEQRFLREEDLVCLYPPPPPHPRGARSPALFRLERGFRRWLLSRGMRVELEGSPGVNPR